MKKSKLFIKMYISNRQTILDRFTHLGQIKLLSYIIVNCNKSTLRWNIDKTNRQEIIEKLNIGDSTLNKYLSDMSSEKIGALKRLSKGSYEINKDFLDTDLNESKS